MARRAASDNVLRFTKASVAGVGLLPGQTERTVWDLDMPGLGLRVREGGRATWVIRPPRVGGKSALFTLGPVAVMTLTQAKDAARERLSKANLGDAPHVERRAARAEAKVTMGGTVERYLAARKGNIGADYYDQTKRNLQVHCRSLLGIPIATLTRTDIFEKIEELKVTSGAYSANRVRASLSSLFSWAVGAGVVEHNMVTGTNKAVDEKSRTRVLSDGELVRIWNAAGEGHYGRIVKLLILTGQRREEVGGMLWSEVDFAGALWSLPEHRTKNGRPHDVPLSVAAIEVLRAEVPQEDRNLVFGEGRGSFSGYSKSKERLDARVGIEPEWRLHDLRRTAATRMNELKVPPHVVEAILNHVSGSKAGVAGTYNRALYLPEKREALNLWADRVVSLVGPGATPPGRGAEHPDSER